MQGVLGVPLIKSLKPTDKPYEVRDTRLKGLLLRVQPSGAMTYYVEYARGKRISLGRADVITPQDAREQAKGILGDAFQGKDPNTAAKQAKEHTFGTFVDEEYASWAKANVRTHKGTLRRLNQSFADFRKLKLSEITPLLVERWRSDRLKAGTKPSTVNRDLDDLKSSLAKAQQWGFIEVHPIEKVKRTRVDDRATVRFLTEDEQKRLYEALDAREERLRAARDRANAWRAERDYPLMPDRRAAAYADHLKPMVLLSLHTGMRYGELANLTWDDLHLDRAILTMHGFKAKSQKTRHIPLNSAALSLLENWQKQRTSDSLLVFPSRDGSPFDNVRSSWEEVLKAAKITKFRWHDMRHTFASLLVMKGVDLNTVRVLGHSDYQMTLRYAHLAPEHKAAAVAKLVAEPASQPAAQEGSAGSEK
jgi:integrase